MKTRNAHFSTDVVLLLFCMPTIKIFMSILFGIQLNVLLSSSEVAREIRQSLLDEDYCTLRFWAGFVLLFSSIVSLISLLSTYTAWNMIAAVSETNSNFVLGSSIGQYVAGLPRRLIVLSIYLFLLWIGMMVYILLSVGFWSLLLSTITIALLIHTITTLSVFGRIVIHTGAMNSKPMFDDNNNETTIHQNESYSQLLHKARMNQHNCRKLIRCEELKSNKNQDDTNSFSNSYDTNLVGSPGRDEIENGSSELYINRTVTAGTSEINAKVRRSMNNFLRHEIDSRQEKSSPVHVFHAPDVNDDDNYCLKPSCWNRASNDSNDWMRNENKKFTTRTNEKSPFSPLSHEQHNSNVLSRRVALQNNVHHVNVSSSSACVDAAKMTLPTSLSPIDPIKGHQVPSDDRDDDEDEQNVPVGNDIPHIDDKDVWYNGIYFGDDDNDGSMSEKTSLLRQDQMERGKYLTAIPESLNNSMNELAIVGI